MEQDNGERYRFRRETVSICEIQILLNLGEAEESRTTRYAEESLRVMDSLRYFEAVMLLDEKDEGRLRSEYIMLQGCSYVR